LKEVLRKSVLGFQILSYFHIFSLPVPAAGFEPLFLGFMHTAFIPGILIISLKIKDRLVIRKMTFTLCTQD